jgi:hypothetical protein
MFPKKPSFEQTLYALAILIAFILRFVNLGSLPLSDFEANWALQSLHIVEGLKPAIGANPACVHLTAILFFIFGSTNFLARFVPALAGSLLVVVPILLRERIGRIPSLLLAFFLACDPGLLSLSRLAGSSILAIATVMFTGAFWLTGRRAAAGVSAALALLSGPGAWLGLVGLLLTWAVGLGFKSKVETKDDEDQDTGPAEGPAKTDRWKTLSGPIGWGAGILLFVGTLFLVSPKGLAGMFSALTGFVSGWWTPSGIPLTRILSALFGYEIMPLLFGVVAVVRGAVKRDGLPLRLGVWALAAFLLALAYPARQVGDLAWMALPLWTLSALELSRHCDFEDVGRWEFAGVTVLLVAILTFAWFDFTGVAGAPLNDGTGRLRLLILFGVLLLVALILLLVSTGWSADLARLGGVWAAVIMLSIFTLGAAIGAGGLRLPRTVEVWSPAPEILDADLLIQTADNISDWNKGAVDSLSVAISGVDSPALLWLFRDWTVVDSTSISADQPPAMIVTPAGVQPNLSASYRGEGFRWRQTPAWSSAGVAGWSRWLVTRILPTQDENIVLWVRTDVLIDNQDKTTTTP